ncbi:hypothetical protein MKX67_14535 [Cytobacillus sp. FSL W7-1323]|uniref:hypothetical protein n=1 Tax=Cytobacillus sp. FSL W7-1323 TaxID=2921700 RepID=UPI0031581D85
MSMKPNMTEKQELLLMLEDIYNQLDALETAVQKNLQQLKFNQQEDQIEKVEACHEKLGELEKFPMDELHQQDTTDSHFVKYKLGYR